MFTNALKILWQCYGHACSGHALSIICSCIDNTLSMLWPNLEHAMAMLWTHICYATGMPCSYSGEALIMILACFEIALSMLWSCSGHALSMSWAYHMPYSGHAINHAVKMLWSCSEPSVCCNLLKMGMYIDSLSISSSLLLKADFQSPSLYYCT